MDVLRLFLIFHLLVQICFGSKTERKKHVGYLVKTRAGKTFLLHATKKNKLASLEVPPKSEKIIHPQIHHHYHHHHHHHHPPPRGEGKEEAACVNFRGENVPCATHVDLSCSDPSVEYIADEEDCGRYFRCVDGVLWYYNCAPGTLWDTKSMGREFNGKINKEDFWYYITAIQEKEFSVDQEQLKEYFPIDVVTKGLMDIYQRLLGLTFTKVEGVPVWHPDVELYKVEDTASKETIGYFFLDLFPREGKYGHAAMWQIQPGSLDPEGNRAKAVAGMACNFPKPTSDRPSLLYHSQVKTYFHEFGHVMHGIASRTNLSYFYGTNVEGDFVEAPSQMLENWVWEEESLRLMSSHYQTKEPIPKEVLEKLVASQKSFSGAKALRQMFFATYDHMLHTRGEADTVAIAKDLYKELLGIDRIEGGNIGATLGHLVGYDGGYYGYMWSEVFSHDMFQTRFAAEGILNPATGKDYRDMILRPGASLDGGVMLRTFLGREPNQDAFLRSKGLEV